jgi:hypothetical protein
MENKKEIVEDLIGELTNRSGFDDWWYSIDEEIQEEIIEELVTVLHNYI